MKEKDILVFNVDVSSTTNKRKNAADTLLSLEKKIKEDLGEDKDNYIVLVLPDYVSVKKLKYGKDF